MDSTLTFLTDAIIFVQSLPEVCRWQIFGFHVWPWVKCHGKIYIKSGCMECNANYSYIFAGCYHI